MGSQKRWTGLSNSTATQLPYGVGTYRAGLSLTYITGLWGTVYRAGLSPRDKELVYGELVYPYVIRKQSPEEIWAIPCGK